MKLPILAGRLRGRWWLPASGGKVLRVLGGTYEPEQTRLVAEHLARGATFVDVGAHAGYYTLLASRLVGRTGRVVAFEPDPRNLGFLRRHVALNRCGNVDVEAAALCDENGVARFERGTGTGTGHLAADGAAEVRTVRLDDYCRERGVTPSAVKIDVEGAELEVLRGAADVLTAHRPVIFLSTHGAAVHQACLRWLRGNGYAVLPILGQDVEGTTEVLCVPAGPAHPARILLS